MKKEFTPQPDKIPTPEEWRWFEQLKKFEVYPQTARMNWKSPQCDGCYEILRPDEEVPAWIKEHYSHRYEIVKDHKIAVGSYDQDSYHIRRAYVQKLALKEKFVVKAQAYYV